MGSLESKIAYAASHDAKSIDLGMAGLKEWPTALSTVHTLVKLDLGGNQLRRVDSSIAQLTKLKSLRLVSNDLSRIPSGVMKLPVLEVLDLMYNDIKSVPAAIGGMSSLRVLNLHGNKLTELPPAMGTLTRLEQLDISTNKIKQLPMELGYCSSLKKLWYVDNPLVHPNLLPRSWVKLGLGKKLYFSLPELREYLEGCYGVKIANVAVDDHSASGSGGEAREADIIWDIGGDAVNVDDEEGEDNPAGESSHSRSSASRSSSIASSHGVLEIQRRALSTVASERMIIGWTEAQLNDLDVNVTHRQHIDDEEDEGIDGAHMHLLKRAATF